MNTSTPGHPPARQPLARRVWLGLTILIITSLLSISLGLPEWSQAQAVFEPPTPAPTPTWEDPLTSLAGAPPAIDVRPEEAPDVRLAQLGVSQLPDTVSQENLPQGVMDFKNPPQWTTPLVLIDSAEQLVAPNPFAAPILETNPDRAGWKPTPIPTVEAPPFSPPFDWPTATPAFDLPTLTALATPTAPPPLVVAIEPIPFPTFGVDTITAPPAYLIFLPVITH